MADQLCPCGRPLHYSVPAIQQHVERLIDALGETQRTQLGQTIYHVPRHYTALHGFKATELAELAERYDWKVEPA